MNPDDQFCNGKYRLIRAIGEGAYGEVWLASETPSNTQVALKFARSENDEASQRFTREITLSRSLDHPHILRADTVEQDGELRFLALPFLAGGSLKDRLEKNGPMTAAEAVAVARQAAEALAYLHVLDIVHRDVHPGNLLFTADGQLKLADLGLAQTADNSTSLWYGSQAARHPGNIVYQPPEATAQGLVLMPLRPVADVYMLGAVLWEMLTGRLYYNNQSKTSRAIVADVPVELDSLVMACLAPTVGRRPEDGGALARLLAALPHGASPNAQSAIQLPGASAPAGKRTARSEPVSKPLEQASAVTLPGGSRMLVWLGLGVAALLVLVVIVSALAMLVGNPNASRNLVSTQAGLVRNATTIARASTRPELTLSVPTVTSNPTDKPAPSATSIPTDKPVLSATPFPSDTPSPLAPLGLGSTQVSPADGMMQVYVPASSFLMGSAENDTQADSDEKPQHTVYLDAFWVDRTEVTDAMYVRCVAAAVCEPPLDKRSATRTVYYGNPTYADYPIVNVTWTNAQTNCEWVGRRLPTEAEWEKAARGTDGGLYPWGDSAPNNALLNYNHTVGDTMAVGSYQKGASPYGAMEMAGNVWEWVADWYAEGYYAHSRASNPAGPANGPGKVLRGGSWANNALNFRAALRIWNVPSFQSYYLGFRCAN